MSGCDVCGRGLPAHQVDEVSYQPFFVCHDCIAQRLAEREAEHQRREGR